MGWKSSTIIVNSANDFNEIELLTELGFKNLKEIESQPFESVIYPDLGTVYIGKYHGNLLICAQDLTITFLEESVSMGEKVLSKHFPDTEISAIALHSVVNFWGYSVTKNSKKLRARAGDADNGTYLNYGEPLEQELELLSKSKEDKDGNRVYFLEDYPDDPFDESQVGEDFVFSLSKRYFGQQMDMNDDLFETQFKGYKFNVRTSNFSEDSETEKSNKWVKYVFYILILILWKVLRETVFND